MQKANDIEIIRDADSGQSSRKEQDVSKNVYGAAGNRGVAEEGTETEVCSEL